MKIETIRHSLAHLMALAIQELYPTVKFGIGPSIENGFYYDFDFQELKITNQDLVKIQTKMKDLIKKDIKFKKKIISKSEAQTIFKNQPYKLEIIKEITTEQISIYQSGYFIDLCAGPHIKTTTEISPEAFTLTKIAGAYWRGSESNPMLTRIYGTGWLSKKELQEHLKNLEQAEKRDHRILGQKLALFIFNPEIGAGLPLWLPKGAILRHVIEEYLYEELQNQGYQWLVTPHIANLNLWKTSGHWNSYRENMYSPIEIDKEKYMLKPMNCPFHIKIYDSKIRSYKELPLRFAELGTVYRYEKSGVLHGLVRVRGFTQDDAHIWCRPKQLSSELVKVLRSGLKILKTFGFENYDICLATRPEKYIGTEEMWKKATNSLEYALKKLKIKYETDPGGGVFYGPKIDIKIKDSLGRAWQCTTIQVDFNLPERFKTTYIDEKSKKQQPIMIHRALLGSIERFIGVLIEHYAGAFPLWLSPEQIWILPITSSHNQYAQQVAKQLKNHNFRIKVIDENETLSKKIRAGEVQKIPYLLIVGDREKQEDSVSVRKREEGNLGSIKTDKFIKDITIEIKNKK